MIHSDHASVALPAMVSLWRLDTFTMQAKLQKFSPHLVQLSIIQLNLIVLSVQTVTCDFLS